jgi:hypothetical protein
MEPEARDKALENAWRTPQADNAQAEYEARLTNPNKGTTAEPPGVGASGAQAALEAARARRDEKLRNAWRNPASKPPAPAADAGQDPYAAYEKRLTNAWRTAT